MSNLAEIRQRNLKSQKVFDYFEELAAIPHGSGNTKAISDYLADFAKKKGLEHYQDELNNIVMIFCNKPVKLFISNIIIRWFYSFINY